MIFGEDDFTRRLEIDSGMALWRAELSDGRVIVQDDGRPGQEPPQAWYRLGDELVKQDLRLVRFWLQFRTNHKRGILPRDAEGYFFRKSAIAQLNTKEVRYSYLIGHLQNGKVMVQRWSVPDLTHIETVAREPVGDRSLILNRRNNAEDHLAHQRIDAGLST